MIDLLEVIRAKIRINQEFQQIQTNSKAEPTKFMNHICKNNLIYYKHKIVISS